MLIEGSPVMAEAIHYAILHVAGTSWITVPLHSTLHAIAILLKQTEKESAEDSIATAVTLKMQENLKLPIQQLNTAALSLEADMQALHAQVEALDPSTIRQAIISIETMAAKIETSTNNLANTTSSYRDTLMCTAKLGSIDSPLIDPQITQCILRQAKQILLTYEEMPEAQESLDSLKHCAEATIQMLLEKGNAPTPNAKIEIEEVTCTRNGGTLFHFNSKEAADWIRSLENREQFAWAFDPAAELKERSHAIFAPFVPLMFKTDDLCHLQEISERS